MQQAERPFWNFARFCRANTAKATTASATIAAATAITTTIASATAAGTEAGITTATVAPATVEADPNSKFQATMRHLKREEVGPSYLFEDDRSSRADSKQEASSTTGMICLLALLDWLALAS